MTSATTNGEKQMQQDGIDFAAGLFGLLVCSLPFYLSIVPVMTDVSQHVLVARIIAEYSDPTLRFADYFSIEWTVAPTSLFYLLLVPLQKLVGPFWDARIYLTMWVVATWLSVWYLAKVQGQEAPWSAALVALPLAFCWYAYKGYLPFLMALPLFALTVAIWIGDRKPILKVVSAWILLVLSFGFHVVGAAAAAAVIACTALAQATLSRKNRKQLILASVAILPLPLLLGVYLLGENAPSAQIAHAGLVSNLVDIVKFTCATLDGGAAILMLLWLCLLSATLVLLLRRCRGATPLLLGAVLLTALAIAMPSSLGALWPAGPRLFPLALILVIASIPWAVLPRPVVVGTCLALLIGLSALTSRHVIVLDKEVRDFLGTTEVVAPGKSILPILVDPYGASRWVDPYFALIAAHTVVRGGSNPYVFAAPHIKTGASPLSYKHSHDRSFAFLYEPRHSAEDYRGVSGSHDYVLLWGVSPTISGVLEQEMITVYVRGSATLFARKQLLQARPAPVLASASSQRDTTWRRK